MDTYTTTASCYNCEWKGNVTLNKGVNINGGYGSICPNCGCTTLTKNSISFASIGGNSGVLNSVVPTDSINPIK